MRLDFGKRTIRLNRYHIFIGLILSTFFLISTSNLSYNTAFVDEAIYATVGEGVLRNIFWERGLSWMSGSYIYPVISALINREFGLTGIRFFSTLCVSIAGLISGFLAYKIGKHSAAFWSIFLFFTTGVVMNLAQLGTYDAPALLFASLSVLLLVITKRSSKNIRWFALLLSSILFAASILTKYIFIIYTPVIGLLVFDTNKKTLFEEKLLQAAVWASIAYFIMVFYVSLNMNALEDFFASGAFSETKTRFFILKNIIATLHIQLVSLIFVIFNFFKITKKKRLLFAVLILGGTASVSYHLFSANFRSMWKHLVITSFFWAPIAGYALSKLVRAFTRTAQKTVLFQNTKQMVVIFALVLLTAHLWTNVQEHWKFQRSWPSGNAVIKYLSENRESQDKILAEGGSVYKYHLFDGFEDPSSWSSTWYMDYNGLSGVEAMKAAIEDKYFDFIILNYYFTTEVDKELEPVIFENYNLVLDDTYKVSGAYDNVTRLWEPKDKSNE